MDRKSTCADCSDIESSLLREVHQCEVKSSTMSLVALPRTAEKTTREMLLTIHLLLLLVLHVFGQQERDRACTMLIVIDQVNHQT